MTADGDDDWDWMITSLKKYKHLHMYELSQPTQVLEWAKQNDVFVADTASVNHRCEVLLLSLPPKLVSSNCNTSKLTKDRDFKMVSGGFHSQPVHSMAMVSEQHFVTSNPSDEGAMLLWEIEEDKDFIVSTDAFKGQRSGSSARPGQAGVSSVAANPQKCFEITRGSVFKDLEVVDLESGKSSWSNNLQGNPSHPIGGIDYMDNFSIVVCDASNGQLCVFDNRQSSHKTYGANPSPSAKPSTDSVSRKEESMKLTQEGPKANGSETSSLSWTCSLNIPSRHYRTRRIAESGEGKTLAALLSSRGDIHIFDLRDVSKPLSTATVTKEEIPYSPCIRWSPRQKNLLSVSGWDNCVRIYDITTFTREPSQSALAEPVFIHDGHTKSQGDALWVTNHLWHKDEPNLLLSAGSDGSLHAWNWLPS